MDGDVWFAGSDAACTAAVEQLGDGLVAMVRTARALAAAQRPIDLAGIDNMVGVYCARALDLPLVEGRKLRDRLKCLETEIDLLERDLGGPPSA